MKLFIGIVVLLGFIGKIDAFCAMEGLYGKSSTGRPLSRPALTDVIPRLELGLRWIRLPEIQIMPSVHVNSVDFNGASTGVLPRRKFAKSFHFSRAFMTAMFALFAHSLVARPTLVRVASMAAMVAGVSAASTQDAMASSSSLFNFDLNILKFKKYSQLSPIQRLATTPVFTLTNSRGNSYLQADTQAGRPEQKIITYYLSSEDAADHLSEMTQSNAQSGSSSAEFRISVGTLEKALETVRAKKQSRKLGRYEVDIVHRIQPSARQYENAVQVVSQRHKGSPVQALRALHGINIPVFRAQGLSLTRANREVVVPHYFALEDLQEDWQKVRTASTSARPSVATTETDRAAGPLANRREWLKETMNRLWPSRLSLQLHAAGTSIPPQPAVSVHDLADVLCQAAGLTSQDLHTASAPSTTGSIASTWATLCSAVQTPLLRTTDHTPVVVNDKEPIAPVVGFVPPRREIEMVRKFYRNLSGFRNEFSKAKILE